MEDNVAEYALLIVDMIRDNVKTDKHDHLSVEGTKIIPNIVELADAFRRCHAKVIFACDSFMEGDFIFQGRMQPHAIRGSGGDQPIPELGMQPSDLYLPKRRLSSFYKTDLDQTLRTWGVDTAVVCGIVTYGCVLLTAMDAIQNDFKSVIVSDASACPKPSHHQATLDLYSGTPLDPLMRVLTVSEMIEELEQHA